MADQYLAFMLYLEYNICMYFAETLIRNNIISEK